jgi:hypothetical protein
MAVEVTPPVTVGFLKAYVDENNLSDDLVITDATGAPFHEVTVNQFDVDGKGGQSVVALG